jgi:hypothetical protein
MPYAILRFAKRKGGGIASTERHNERKKDVYKSNPDIDTGRSRYNYNYAEPPKTYKAYINQRIAEAGCRVRKDSVLVVETLVTASPEFMARFDDEGRAFFARAYQFMAGRVGEDNIISAPVHVDEATPHMHLCFVPITRDGRLCAKEILGNQKRLSQWQTDFHKFMSQEYPDLERGVSAIETGRRHVPVWLYKAAERLDREYGRVVAALSDIGAFNAGRKRDEALAILAEWLPEARRFTAQVKTVDSEITRLKEGQRKDADYEGRLRSKNYGLEEEALHAKQETYQLKERLRKTERLLSKVPPEVLEQIQENPRQRGRSR